MKYEWFIPFAMKRQSELFRTQKKTTQNVKESDENVKTNWKNTKNAQIALKLQLNRNGVYFFSLGAFITEINGIFGEFQIT